VLFPDLDEKRSVCSRSRAHSRSFFSSLTAESCNTGKDFLDNWRYQIGTSNLFYEYLEFDKSTIMAKKVNRISIPDEVIMSKIYLIRDQKVN
jgi:hypothetical protein